MKNIFIIIITLFFINLQSQELKDFVAPKHYIKIAEAKGDLDKDGKDELIIVYNTNKRVTSDFDNGLKRELFILKNINGKLKILEKNSTLVFASEIGFYPDFNILEINIENNTFVVTQIFYTNSRHTQTYKHTFRYQNNDFYLMNSYDRFEDNCDFNFLNEVNFSTGKVIIEEEYSSCDDDQKDIPKDKYQSFKHKFAKLIKLYDFRIGERKFKIPKSNNYFYY